MKATEKLYDKNGTLLVPGDKVYDGYDKNTIEVHFDNEYFIAGFKSMWKIEQFRLEAYKDGVLLVDFEKLQEEV